ncbi:M23 family peptidase, partial [Streptomyces sp. NPDC006265]
MASNRPAPAAQYAPKRETDTFGFGGQRTDEGPFQEWNPTEESIRPARGRHRVTKQRGGGLARSSTVLGVGVIAAVGAGGMASAQTGKPPVSISVPDLPSVGSLISDDDTPEGSATPLSSLGTATADTAKGTSGARVGAGDALRARIMAQVEHQQEQIETKAAEDAAA